MRTDHEGCFSVLLAVSLCAFAAEYAPLSSAGPLLGAGGGQVSTRPPHPAPSTDAIKMSAAAGKRTVAPATKPARRVF